MAQDLSEMLGQVMENPGLVKILANPALAQILADPAFATMVQNLRQQMGIGETGTVPDMSVLAEKLPAMLSMLSGMGGGTSETVNDGTGGIGVTNTGEEASAAEDTAAAEEKTETEKPAVPMQVLFRPEARDKRNKLLSALKPYLSSNRCAMIDRAMSAMQLGELLGTMGVGTTQQGEG